MTVDFLAGAASPNSFAGMIQGGEIHIWSINLENVPLKDAGALDEAERQRATRYRFARDQQRFIASRIALRWILADYLKSQPGL